MNPQPNEPVVSVEIDALRSAERVKALVWDFPLRVLHWGFALCFAAAWYIGTYYDPEGDPFKYHMLLGIAAGCFLLLRVMLGFIGSRYGRWVRFFFSPLHTARYFVQVLLRRTPRYTGMNPGTSLVATGMYLLVAGLIYTGLDAEVREDWHGRLASMVIWLIGLHLLGLIVHTLSHWDGLPLAMIHGKKTAAQGEGLARENRVGGWILFALACAILGALFAFFDRNESVLKIPGLPPFCLPLVQKG